jgi:DNA-binding MarR family transcriptional regulator
VDAWHEIAMSLRGAYLAVHRQAEGEFARYSITADQFVVLAALQKSGVLPQSAVCRLTFSDPNTMGAMLALMETRGLVKRMRHPSDGRARTVVLKPKGERIFAKVWAHREGTRKRMEALFTGAEIEALVQMLKRINQELAPSPGRGKRPNVAMPDGIVNENDSPPVDPMELRS